MAKEQRLVFGEVAELYDKARPSYPSALIDHLVGLVPPGRPARALDVGCGTGKATVLLASRGLGGVGLEPDRDMAAVARRNLAPFPQWSVAEADFEEYQPEDSGAFDIATCAQAWHWLDPARRFEHAAGILRPGGWLALFWNRTGEDHSAIRREVDAVYAELFPALSPHGKLTAGNPPVGAAPSGAGFGEPTTHVFTWARRYTAGEWADLAQTHSDHRLLHPDQRQRLVARLTEVIDAHGGVYEHPYACWLWTARREP